MVELPTIPYTGNGDFTVNLWVKSDGQGQDAGIGYIFSHKKLGLEEGSQSNPQVGIYPYGLWRSVTIQVAKILFGTS